MTTNPYMIERRASSFEEIFPRIDARRWEWASRIMAEAGMPSAAELAAEFAAEHRMLADRLSGAAAIGACEDDAEVTASAVAFGGPLPTGRVA